MVSFLFAVFLVLGIFYWVKKREKKQEEKELAEIYRKGAEARARFMAQDALERQMLRQSLEENPLQPYNTSIKHIMCTKCKIINFNGYELSHKQLAYLSDHYDLGALSYEGLGILLGHLSETCPSLFGNFRNYA